MSQIFPQQLRPVQICRFSWQHFSCNVRYSWFSHRCLRKAHFPETSSFDFWVSRHRPFLYFWYVQQEWWPNTLAWKVLSETFIFKESKTKNEIYFKQFFILITFDVLYSLNVQYNIFYVTIFKNTAIGIVLNFLESLGG